MIAPAGSFRVVEPADVDAVMAAHQGTPDSRYLGGGTDLLVNLRRGLGTPSLLIDLRGITCKTLRARDLGNDIAFAAWSSADPGIQFHSIINEWHTCPESGEIRASNPCSEYMFLDDTACNLASMNLVKFYNLKEKKFSVDLYRHATRIWTIVLEISVTMAQFPSRNIAQLSYKYRTLGLGYANLGTLLMLQGIPYDSNEGFAICGALTAIMHMSAYATSAEMAKEIGTFPGFKPNKKHMLRVIRNHRRASFNVPNEEYENLKIYPVGINPKHCPSDLLKARSNSSSSSRSSISSARRWMRACRTFKARATSPHQSGGGARADGLGRSDPGEPRRAAPAADRAAAAAQDRVL